MTVSKIEPVNNYSGNSSTTTFDFDFLIEHEDELLVQHTNSLGVQTTLTLGIDYTINEIGNVNGSYITFPIAGSTYSVLTADEVISLTTNLDIEQTKEYKNSSKLSFYTLEWSLDYITRLIQQIARQVARSVKTQEGSLIEPNELVNKLFEAEAEAQKAVSAASEKAEIATTAANEAEIFANIAKQAAFYDRKIDKFVTAQGQKDFELSFEIDKVERILSFNINNHNILPDRYTLKNSKTVSLSNELNAGCEVAITYLAGDLVSTDAVLCNCFIFEQATPASDWNIFHKLGRYPQVTVIDNDEDVCEAEVSYLDEYNLTITFNQEMTGRAYMI